MKSIEQLYDELSGRGVMFFNYATVSSPAVAMKDRYASAIFVNERLVRTKAEEKAAVAHEAGHLFCGATHPVGSPPEVIAHDEYVADTYAAGELLSASDIKEAAHAGYTEIWQMAEHFNLPEQFIRRAIYIYRCKGML